MDYEKNKEALVIVKQMVTDGQISQEVAEKYFPEFAKSEDKKIRKEIISMSDTLGRKDWIAWLEKQGGCSAEWSEEELDSITAAINNLEYLKNNYVYHQMGLEPAITFLKSLKDRVRLQPKQEWSEDTQQWIDAIIKDYEGWYDADEDHRATIQVKINILKSLRPQNWTKEDKERYISCLQRLGTGNPEQPETINSKWFKEHVYPQPTWRPSEEQLTLLSNASNGLYYNCETLLGLLEQLKKLKD